MHADSPRATAFQSWEWLSSWWDAYGDLHRLRLVEVRDEGAEGRLVGLAPLMLAGPPGRPLLQGGPFGNLQFVGTGLTDHADVLLRDGFEETAGRAMVEEIAGMGGWGVADLKDLAPEAAAWGVFAERWAGARAVLEGQGCALIQAGSEDEILAGLSKNLRKTVRRGLRLLHDEGIGFVDASPENTAEAVRAVLRLHRESWEGRGITAAHLSPRFARHLAVAYQRLAASGLGGVRELRDRNGTLLVGYLYLGASSDAVGGYLLGVSGEANRRYQTGSLYVWDGLAVARGSGKRWLSTLRGLEPYKVRWNPEVRPNRRLLLASPRSGAFGALARAGFSASLHGARLRARLAEHARTDHTPKPPVARVLRAAARAAKSAKRKLNEKKGGY